MRWQWQGLIINRFAKFLGTSFQRRGYGGKSGCWLSERNIKVDERSFFTYHLWLELSPSIISLQATSLQGCGLGLDVSVSRRSRDVPTSRLCLVSRKIVNVSVSGGRLSIVSMKVMVQRERDEMRVLSRSCIWWTEADREQNAEEHHMRRYDRKRRNCDT